MIDTGSAITLGLLLGISFMTILTIWNDISKDESNKSLKDRLFEYADYRLLTSIDHKYDLEESLRVVEHTELLENTKLEIESRYNPQNMIANWTTDDKYRYENVRVFLSDLQRDQKDWREKLATKRQTRIFLITAMATILLVAVSVIKI